MKKIKLKSQEVNLKLISDNIMTILFFIEITLNKQG